MQSSNLVYGVEETTKLFWHAPLFLSTKNSNISLFRELGWPLVDLMFVMDDTWIKLRRDAILKQSGQLEVAIPSVQHLIALKLHASKSATRVSPEKDWVDVEELIRLHKLDFCESKFAALILQYGGKEALERLEIFWQNTGRKFG